MSVNIDFSLPSYQDGTLVVPLQPPVGISGWNISFTMWRRPQTISGSVSGLITKSAASGFNNVSGIQVSDGVAGVFNVNLYRLDVSGGLDPGNYFYQIARLDSGNATILTTGFRQVPS